MIDKKIEGMGITLSEPPAPAGAYIPVVITGKTAFVSGQIPIVDGKIAYRGKVTEDNIEDAKKSARICAINILAQLKKELGTLDRVARIVKVSGFVNSSPEFTKHPQVINAASDLFFEIFGQKGKHARIAMGVASLPLDSMTEIDAIVEFSSV